jgi:PKD repeat protein
MAVCITVPATATIIPNHYHNYLQVANDEGPRFDIYNNGTYYQGQDNGGFNAVWLTQNLATVQGQKITTSNTSGTFYMMDTGGRGWEDDGLVMLAVNGTIPDDFKVHIRTSGYTWTPISKKLRPTIDQITYVDGALDETFTKDDLIYGPQLWRPAGAVNYPIYDGQNMTDTNNTFRIMFIDLRAGIIGSNTTAGSPPLQNNGGIRVDYSFENLTTFAAFDIYGYCKDSNAGEGISWTNAVNTFSQISHGQASIGSGLCVIGVPSSTAPISIPSATHPPTDPNGDGLYEDLNGDGTADFNDVVLFFNQMDWIAENEPIAAFDFNKNGSIDFDDIVLLFNML